MDFSGGDAKTYTYESIEKAKSEFIMKMQWSPAIAVQYVPSR